MVKLINRIPGSRFLITSLPGSLWERMLNRSGSIALSTSVLKALPGKLDIKRHSPSILYIWASKGDFGADHICSKACVDVFERSKFWSEPFYTAIAHVSSEGSSETLQIFTLVWTVISCWSMQEVLKYCTDSIMVVLYPSFIIWCRLWEWNNVMQ